MASSGDEGSTTVSDAVTKKKRTIRHAREAVEIPKHWAPTKDRKSRRKETKTFQFEDAPEPKSLETEGPGLKLKKIPAIRHNMELFAKEYHKEWTDLLKEVHLIFYGKTASKFMLRRNIMEFAGISFKKNSAAKEHLISRLEHRSYAFLQWFASLLGLPDGKKKEDLIDDVLVPFINKPNKKVSKKRKAPEKSSSDVKKTNTGKRVTPSKNADDYYSDSDVEDEEEEEKKEDKKDDKKAKGKAKPKVQDKKEEKEDEEEEDEEEEEEEEQVKKPAKKKRRLSKPKGSVDPKSLEVGQYFVQYAVRKANCQDTKCKGEIPKGELRFGRMVKSMHGDTPQPKYYHPDCLFNALSRVREGTPVVTSTDELLGFDEISAKDQKKVEKLFAENTEEADEEEEKEKPAKKQAGKRKRVVEEDQEEEEKEEDEEPAKKKAKEDKEDVEEEAEEEEDEDEDVEAIIREFLEGFVKSKTNTELKEVKTTAILAAVQKETGADTKDADTKKFVLDTLKSLAAARNAAK